MLKYLEYSQRPKNIEICVFSRYTENHLVGQYTITSNVDEEKCDGNRVA